MSEVKLNHLTTERRNEKTMNLDTLSTHELLEIMNEEDHKVPEAVREAIPEIEKAVQAIIKALRSGGRLIYMGAGTSGRLGVIDSAECMPTFGTTYEVVGLLAGGPDAFLTAVEGAEDDAELGKQDLVDQK
ncbi:MAG: N-acetylmuramic acid 6-phosphate etherase, partial [Holdemania filiformis]